MASVVSLAGSLGLLLVSALPEVLGDRTSPDHRAHPGDAAQVGPGATETRRRPPPPPPKNQRERAWAGALPLGALYTAAAVAFVLYKCLQQGKDEATFLQEEAGKKDSLQSEQQLAQLTQQLAQTEQHLNSLMAQLEPLFERSPRKIILMVSWARTTGPAVQLLLLLLLLVPAHPQSLLWMQGAPTTGGDSSGEDDPLREEDLPSEEDIPGEEDPPGKLDPPGMKTEAGEEDSLKIEDLPTVETPRDTQGPQNNAHRDKKGDDHSHWRYGGAPPWPQVSPACAGRFQSPVDIRPELTAFCPALRPLELLGFELPPQPELRLRNNGHTVQLSLPPRLEMALGPGQEYRALQLHLHWGAAGRPGSEHTVGGHRFPAEIHVVHLSTAFAKADEALGRPGGLAVLAAFLQEGPEENSAYEQLLSHLGEIAEEDSETWVPGLDVSALLPSDLSRYFRYEGSLTTPPCAQGVIWTVFNQTVKLSAKQLHALSDSLWGPDDSRLQLNFRATQPLNGRIIEASFPAGVDSSPGTVEPVHLNSCLAAGDILALVFGLLFAVTSIAFLVQMRRQQRHPSGTKGSVRYHPAEVTETVA
ncbi:carbonic anhydrase 9 isoform X2 [Globicephala melas]|uniref:carbonic anhydrase 9 isoform X2 n=1 Tax=Globicephala melas TaxID=9731 RepID=UPI00293D8D76|nr:carbonic anhydrase 9 isoform X2 [Globicephala melas]XP_060156759.1 carbonic anhydrase 9 isoform X2 [Globicephala melas]XP_060156760.1 carbonic anhydrase 9 isoform X2 [Globicephala melas]